jgi:hypothetical protein
VTYLYVFPLLLPVPSLDCHIVTSGQHDARSWMNSETSDVVWVGLEGGDFLVRVVIEGTKLEVV